MKLWTSPWVSCLVILILCFGSECGTVRRKGRSKRELVRIREAKATIPGACATRLPRGKRSLPGLERRVLRQRRRSSQAEENSPDRGKAVYFTGRGDQLRLKPGVEIPRGNFTLEMWIKPEGGQRSPTVIAGRIVYTSSIQLSAQLILLVTPKRVKLRHDKWTCKRAVFYPSVMYCIKQSNMQFQRVENEFIYQTRQWCNALKSTADILGSASIGSLKILITFKLAPLQRENRCNMILFYKLIFLPFVHFAMMIYVGYHHKI